MGSPTGGYEVVVFQAERQRTSARHTRWPLRVRRHRPSIPPHLGDAV